MMGLLEFVYNHKKEIKNLVIAERKKLTGSKRGESLAIQMEHAQNGKKLILPVFSLDSQSDTLIEVSNYKPVVKSLCDVGKPAGYLIPISLKELTDWIERQGLYHLILESEKN